MKQRLFSIASLLLLAAMAGAFIKDKPKGKDWIPEETEASIASKQQYQGTRPELGNVPLDTTPQKADAPMSDSSARSILDSGSVDEKQVLTEGSERLSEKPKSNVLIWAIFGTIGLGTVFAFRHWASKNIPEMPTKKNMW